MATSTGVLTGSVGDTILEQIQLATLPSDLGLNTSLLSKTSPALRVFQEKAKRESGSPIRVQVRHNRNTTKWYSGYDPLAAGRQVPLSSTGADGNEFAAGTNQFGQAIYNWRNLAVSVGISEDQLVENASMNIADLLGRTSIESLPERDRHTVFNIFGKEVEMAFEDLTDSLATALLNKYTAGATETLDNAGTDHRVDTAGTDDGHGTSINSLFDVVSPNAMGGLAATALDDFGTPSLLNSFQAANDSGTTASNQEKWQARVCDLSEHDDADEAGNLTRTILGLALHDTSQGGTDSVDYIFCNPKVYVALEQVLENAVRRDENMSNIGFLQNMQWGAFGCTILADPFMPEQDVIGINSKHTYMVVHPSLDSEFSGFKPTQTAATIEGQLKIKTQIVCDDRAKNFWLQQVTKVEGTAV